MQHSRRPLYLFLLLFCGGTLLCYYASIDSLVRRQSRHQMPPFLANDLCHQTGARWRPVSITAHDGAQLHSWLFEPANPNGRAVIVMHMMGGSRLSMLPPVWWLLRSGFTCLVPDGRAHGMSGGANLTFGLRERLDVKAWVAKLREEAPDVRSVSGLGVSLGALVLLQAAAAGAGLDAIVADSTGADLSQPYYHLTDRYSIPEPAVRLLAPVVQPLYWNARWRYGLHLEQVSPLNAIRSLRIPILLVHGIEDSFIPIGHARRLHRANPEYSTLWEVPGVEHTQAFRAARKEYMHRAGTLLLTGMLR